jgi:hypothetical protein
MAYNPGSFQESLSISQYQATTGTSVTKPALNSYNIFYTSLNTKPNGKVRLVSTATEGPGYRVDVADKRDIVAVNDEVTIASTVYKVRELVTPEIAPDSGKIVSPQNINDSPIDVFPSTKRTYRFDISININDI